MRRPGLIGTIRLAVALVIAGPAGFFGLVRLWDGDLLVGGAFLGLAVVVVLVERRVTNPLDPLDVAESISGRIRGRRD